MPTQRAEWPERHVSEFLSIHRLEISLSGRQFGGVIVHGKEVIRFELGIIGQDLLLGCPA